MDRKFSIWTSTSIIWRKMPQPYFLSYSWLWVSSFIYPGKASTYELIKLCSFFNYSGLDVFEVCPKTLETGIPLPYTYLQLKVTVLEYKLWGISVLLKDHSEEVSQLQKADNEKFRVATIMNLKDKRGKENTEIRTWIPICLVFFSDKIQTEVTSQCIPLSPTSSISLKQPPMT